MEMTTLDELEKLLGRADFGRLAFVQTDEDDGYIDDGNHEKPIAQALSVYHGLAIVAAINALPGLLARLERYDDALDEIAAHYNGGITGPGRLQADSMREIARAALAKDATT